MYVLGLRWLHSSAAPQNRSWCREHAEAEMHQCVGGGSASPPKQSFVVTRSTCFGISGEQRSGWQGRASRWKQLVVAWWVPLDGALLCSASMHVCTRRMYHVKALRAGAALTWLGSHPPHNIEARSQTRASISYPLSPVPSLQSPVHGPGNNSPSSTPYRPDQIQ
jgi:hypothetical protein